MKTVFYVGPDQETRVNGRHLRSGESFDLPDEVADTVLLSPAWSDDPTEGRAAADMRKPVPQKTRPAREQRKLRRKG